MEDKIKNLLKSKKTAPFLFIGSGFSKRYLGMESWSDLLRKFSEGIKDYEYYLSTGTAENLPKVASLMATDFHEYFWADKKYNDLRSKSSDLLINSESALKVAISDYIHSISESILDNLQEEDEINIFKELNIDGFITTNWDTFLEELFPSYKVFIGQNQLLFSNPQSIGEIYKIHGCVTDPNSLILTEGDYEDYKSKNMYLASKLITLFIEHPIIYLGYSLSDPNIIQLLESIVYCLSESQIEELGKNLIFVKWDDSIKEESISESIIVVGSTKLPITLIQLKSFVSLYKSLQDTKHKIPARVLRYCKEQLYSIVHGSEPSSKIHVVDLEEIDEQGDIEYVIGVGVSDYLSAKGYEQIESDEVFEDLIFENKSFEARDLLTKTVPYLLSRTKYIPVFKYLSILGITSESHELESLKLNKALDVDRADYITPSYRSHFDRENASLSFDDFINNNSREHIILETAFYEKEKIDFELLESFIKDNFNYFMHDSKHYKSPFRKLICLYDRLKYGWD